MQATQSAPFAFRLPSHRPAHADLSALINAPVDRKSSTTLSAPNFSSVPLSKVTPLSLPGCMPGITPSKPTRPEAVPHSPEQPATLAPSPTPISADVQSIILPSMNPSNSSPILAAAMDSPIAPPLTLEMRAALASRGQASVNLSPSAPISSPIPGTTHVLNSGALATSAPQAVNPPAVPPQSSAATVWSAIVGPDSAPVEVPQIIPPRPSVAVQVHGLVSTPVEDHVSSPIRAINAALELEQPTPMDATMSVNQKPQSSPVSPVPVSSIVNASAGFAPKAWAAGPPAAVAPAPIARPAAPPVRPPQPVDTLAVLRQGTSATERVRRVCALHVQAAAIAVGWSNAFKWQTESATFHRLHALRALQHGLTEKFLAAAMGTHEQHVHAYLQAMFKGDQEKLERHLEVFIEKFVQGEFDAYLTAGRFTGLSRVTAPGSRARQLEREWENNLMRSVEELFARRAASATNVSLRLVSLAALSVEYGPEHGNEVRRLQMERAATFRKQLLMIQQQRIILSDQQQLIREQEQMLRNFGASDRRMLGMPESAIAMRVGKSTVDGPRVIIWALCVFILIA